MLFIMASVLGCAGLTFYLRWVKSSLPRNPASQTLINWKDPNVSCKLDPEDPYAPDARLPRDGSKYAGECLDTRINRGIRIVDASALQSYDHTVPPFTAVVANFRHNNQYWVAEIPLHDIQQIVFQREADKSGNVAHHQLRFIMDSSAPLRLFPQKQSQRAGFRKPILIYDFDVSAVGLRPMSLSGSAFDPIKGMAGDYGQGMGFLSSNDVWLYETVPLQHDLVQYQMRLSSDQREELLAYFIERSNAIRETVVYNSLFENCVVEIFRGIFRIARHKDPVEHFLWKTFHNIESLPFTTLSTLRQLHMIGRGETSRVPNMSKEVVTKKVPVPLKVSLFRD